MTTKSYQHAMQVREPQWLAAAVLQVVVGNTRYLIKET